jgi:hypothetical protein
MEQASVAAATTSAEAADEKDLQTIEARRTAFVARFIVLRESKRTRAHRIIEMMASGLPRQR